MIFMYVLYSFLFFQENICCGCSYEAPWQGTSNEYHKVLFHVEIRKISVLFGGKKITLSRALADVASSILKVKRGFV